MNGIVCLLEEAVEEQIFREYVGQTLWVINSIQHLKTTSKNEMPQFVEIYRHEKATSTMTAEEIKQHILERLRC